MLEVFYIILREEDPQLGILHVRRGDKQEGKVIL